jgi:hypothetical protein
MPQASAAIAISSTLSSVSVPCSQSSSTQSKPAAPIISTICGEGIITDTPNTGSPARSFSFIRFGFILLEYTMLCEIRRFVGRPLAFCFVFEVLTPLVASHFWSATSQLSE